VAGVTVAAAVSAGLFAGVATGVIPHPTRPAAAPRAGRPAVPTATAGTPQRVAGSPAAPASLPVAAPSLGTAAGPAGTCPGQPEVLAAAAAEEPGTAGAPMPLTGPACAAGWAAALVGLPDGTTRRIVLRRGTGRFATVVYQRTLETCPPSIAAMPAALRASVAC
jgi:hypothetical protein